MSIRGVPQGILYPITIMSSLASLWQSCIKEGEIEGEARRENEGGGRVNFYFYTIIFMSSLASLWHHHMKVKRQWRGEGGGSRRDPCSKIAKVGRRQWRFQC